MASEGDERQLLAIDVYAFGVTLWEMIMRQRPHKNLDANRIWVKLLSFYSQTRTQTQVFTCFYQLSFSSRLSCSSPLHSCFFLAFVNPKDVC